jgi:hypothetical protein
MAFLQSNNHLCIQLNNIEFDIVEVKKSEEVH